jgi:CYTH domain-containing protein/predicted ATPase
MKKEIERRWIVKSFDMTGNYTCIRQCYFGRNYARVRVETGIEDVATITTKSGNGLCRDEDEAALPVSLAEAILDGADSVVEKFRFRRDGWEIDVFGGHLSGLILAEKEMQSEDETVTIPVGLVLGQEVTATLDNRMLSMQQMSYRRRVPRIVVTGAPCAGKSTLMRELLGAAVQVVPEIATILIAQVGVHPATVGQATFQQTLYKMIRGVEDGSDACASEKKLPAVITDRGTLDGAAFSTESFYADIGSSRDVELCRYDGVVWLGPAPRVIYAREFSNNTARYQTYEEAVSVGDHLRTIYSAPGVPMLVLEEYPDRAKKVLAFVERIAERFREHGPQNNHRA